MRHLRHLHSLVVGLAGLALAASAAAAPLPDTPDTLREKSRLLRESRDRPWNPATGELGNLQLVHIVADGCTVRIVSGPDNRLIGPRDRVRVMDDTHSANNPRVPARDVTLTARAARGDLPRGTACFTLQVATADDFILSGNDAAFLFDHVDMTAMRLYLNPSAPLRLWFQDVRIGLLSVTSNASALVGGSGQVQWLQLSTSQGSTAMFFHEMDSRHVGVSTTTTRPRFSIHIGEGTGAGYYQPARAPGEIARLYPIWIDGPLGALEVPAGHVDPMPLTLAIRNEARALRDEVLARAGSAAATEVARAPAPATPTTQGQVLADAFQRYLPDGVVLTSMALWNGVATMEGTAPDAAAVKSLQRALDSSADVVHVRLTDNRPQGAQTHFRLLATLACKTPGAPSVCLAGSGPAYTAAELRAVVLPLLGPMVTLTKLELRDGDVLVEGAGTDADINAGLARVGKQALGLQRSMSAVGKGTFWARFHLACPVPPRPGGICQMPAASR